jgi:DNA-binding IclR family transcriptional regulator
MRLQTIENASRLSGSAEEKAVRSVERAFSILMCFTLDEDELTLMDIARKMQLPTTTVSRMVNTLVRIGFLEKSPAKTYSLGANLYYLGAVARNHFKLQKIAYPYMKQVRDTTKEAVSLYVLDGDARVCYEHVESLLSMRCVVRVGDRFPLWAGAAGKCILAYADSELVDREIAKAKPITPNTLVSREGFLADLESIRKKGYAISYGEREEGITSIAIPIFHPRNKVTIVFSVAGPSVRFTDEVVEELLPVLKKMTAEISKSLSYR